MPEASVTTPTCPYPIGTQVRLVRPEGPRHPRAGRVGIVTDAKWYPPRYRPGRAGRPAELLFAGVWLCWVRFPILGIPDRWDSPEIGTVFGAYDWELGPVPAEEE